MAKYVFLVGLLVIGGFAFPAPIDDGAIVNEDMSFFFDYSEEHFEAFIVGGNAAAEGAYPWMAALTLGRPRSFTCGGSIINNRRVLTAAHCITPLLGGGGLAASVQVHVGTNRWNSGGVSHDLQGHRLHPQYNPNNLKNDLGLLLTRNNIAMNNRVRAIPLSWDFIGANIPCRVSGWGRTSNGGSLSPTLQELRKNTVGGQHCINEIARVSRTLNVPVPHVDPNLELCTFLALNRGTCQGDSGSALVRNSNNAQIGLVTWGIPCARGAPDIYVRISAYRNWLTSNM